MQERDRRLLEALEQLVVLDREQAQVVGPFHSIPRANARLLALTRAGLLRRSFIPFGDFGRKAIYRLPQATGQRLIETRVAHQLALNRAYLWLRLHARRDIIWRPGTTPVGGLNLIPDAYAELGTSREIIPVFIEADCGTEPLSIWKKKTAGYVALASSGAFPSEFGHARFRVLVFAPTMRRAGTISSAIATLTTKLFWITSYQTINHAAPNAPIWLRPGRPELGPLSIPCATVDHAAGSAPANPDSVQSVARPTM